MKQGFTWISGRGLGTPFLSFTPKSRLTTNVVKGLRETEPEFVVYNGFNGRFVVTPIFPPSPNLNAPQPASDGFASVLIDDIWHLESLFRDISGAY